MVQPARAAQQVHDVFKAIRVWSREDVFEIWNEECEGDVWTARPIEVAEHYLAQQ